MSEVLYRKYRPSTFSDVVNQEHVKTTIQNQIASGTVAHAYLFMGPRGVGKTTIARLIARTVNCEKQKKSEPCNTCASCKAILEGSAMDVIEIDAASHTDVDNVRENIIGNVRFAPNQLKYKVFIIDEVHMLSTSAFNALLKTLEEPPAHAKFVLATTEIHKVPETIISRCQRYDFKRVPVAAMVDRLKTIAKAEQVEVGVDVLREVARHSDGCLRDAESLLGQIFSLGEKKVDMDTASLVLPATTTVLVLDFLEAIAEKDAAKAVGLLNDYVEQGVDMTVFLDDSVGCLRNLLLASLGDRAALTEEYDAASTTRAEGFLDALPPEKITRAIELLLEARRQSKTDKIPQLSAELAVMSLCGNQNFTQPGGSFSSPATSSAPRAEKPAAPPAPAPTPEVQTVSNSAPKPVPAEGGPTASVQEVSIVAEETVLGGSVPVISLDEVKRKWPEVFKQLQEQTGTLPIVLNSGRIEEVKDHEVEMCFDFALHAEVVNKDKNRKLVETVFKKVFGAPLRIRAKHQRPEEDETVSGLLEEFGGSVV